MPTWVITGANRGLGLEFVSQLSKDSNTTIIATTRSLSRSNTDLKSFQSTNSKLHILECDTSSETSIKSLGREVTKLLGGSTKIDFLLNNAGINHSAGKDSLALAPSLLNEHINVNVLGPALTVQALFAHLQSGSVVMNMTSGLGSVAFNRMQDPPFATAYAISKGALNMLTVHQAGQLKRNGVTVICMDPGWVKTDMGGEGAVLEKRESITGMLRVLKKVGIEESGRFYVYDGSKKAW